MITFEKNNNKFNFRVAGLAISEDRILLHTTLKDDFWNLPGGRVEFNESTDSALAREIEEELGIQINIEKLIYVNEDFFKYDNKRYHELGFYYLISFPEDHEITNNNDEFYGIEDDGRLIFKWFSFEELSGIKLYPEIIRTEIKTITQMRTIKHYINHQQD
jgi:8-oxo-dGTP pyrophosphatase MutT (NUDIX family)